MCLFYRDAVVIALRILLRIARLPRREECRIPAQDAGYGASDSGRYAPARCDNKPMFIARPVGGVCRSDTSDFGPCGVGRDGRISYGLAVISGSSCERFCESGIIVHSDRDGDNRAADPTDARTFSTCI
jgi:hypothetical protein